MSGTELEVSPDMSPDDVLAHYGKKGMRWGVTTDSDSGGSGGQSAPRKPSTMDVKNARLAVTKQSVEVQQAKAWAKANTAKGTVERTLADAKVKEMKVEFLKNPDRLTAARMTKGEWVVTGMLIGSGVGTAAGIGVMVGRKVGTSVIKRQQRRASNQ